MRLAAYKQRSVKFGRPLFYQQGPYITVIHDGDIRAPQSRGSAYFDICFVYGNRELVTTDCRIRSTEPRILLPKFFSDSTKIFLRFCRIVFPDDSTHPAPLK